MLFVMYPGSIQKKMYNVIPMNKSPNYSMTARQLSKNNKLAKINVQNNFFQWLMMVTCKCTHGAPKSSLGTRSKVTVRSRSNWNLEMLVFMEGGKLEYQEKNPWSRDENQQQTQPTYGAEAGNRTQATSWWKACEGGKCSTTAPSLLPHVLRF